VGIAVLERFADGPGKQAEQADLKDAYEAAEAAVEQTISESRAFYAARAVVAAVEPTLAWWTARWSADLWLTAVGKAGKDAGDRILPTGELDPVRLAVLADALEEAGAGGEVVEHLRGPGPHVRGCFVIDALTGRS
jgi:hypothetical protein